MRNPYDILKETIEKMGYAFFTGEENINIIGVRTEDVVTNEFDDELLVAIQLNDVRQVFSFRDFTTDPGFYYLKQKFLNPKGCAILKPGQYRGMYAIGSHRDSGKALVQVGKCTVYRDRNKDNTINKKTESTGLFGINMHHAYDRKGKIDKHSAGCQVHRNRQQLGSVLGLCKKSAAKFGPTFTYTLIMRDDLPEEFFESQRPGTNEEE